VSRSATVLPFDRLDTPPDRYLVRLDARPAASLLAMVGRCSAETLYERFLTHAPAAGPRHVESLFTDPHSHTVVASCGAEVVGFGSLFFAGADSAEIALLVADGYRGQGIGTALAEDLCGYAADAGIRRLELTALARNHRVVRLFRGCAADVAFERPDAGTVTAIVSLVPRPVLAAA
jgi:GNAT superfamily N-acetyltransferase